MSLTLLSLLLAVADPVPAAEMPNDVLTVSASMDSGEWTPGSDHVLNLEVTMKDGWSASTSGIPQPLLQIQKPASVTLEGKVLTKFEDLARNEFLQAPYERLIEGTRAEIGFTVKGDPRDGETLAFTVLAYVSDDPDSRGWFVRKRMEVELKPDAVAKEVSAEDSTWGDSGVLQIGDDAESFELPRADESYLVMDDYLYEKNIVVTTYRAYW